MKKQPAKSEWYFFDQEGLKDQAWETILLPSRSSDRDQTPKLSKRSALWSSFFLLTLVVTAPLWIQPWQRVTAPRSKVIPANTASPLTRSLKTTYFQFYYRPQDMRAVQQVADTIDQQYLTLRQDFGLAAPTPQSIIEVRILTLTSPIAQYSTTLATDKSSVTVMNLAVIDEVGQTTLTQSMVNWLTRQALDEVVQRTPIKPVWQPMLQGLQRYFMTHPSSDRGSMSTLEFQMSGQFFSLDAALREETKNQSTSAQSGHPELSTHSFIVAEPLAAYLVTTYGRRCMGVLLAGFSHYDSWEALSPAVFGLGAKQLEVAWYAKIHQQAAHFIESRANSAYLLNAPCTISRHLLLREKYRLIFSV